MNNAAQPQHRRWLQFKLRTLLIAVLVLSLPLSWFGMKLERARNQREAVEDIRRVGGWVKLTEQGSLTPVLSTWKGCPNSSTYPLRRPT